MLSVLYGQSYIIHAAVWHECILRQLILLLQLAPSAEWQSRDYMISSQWDDLSPLEYVHSL